MKNKIHFFLSAVVVMLMMSSCSSVKDIHYFQDIDKLTMQPLSDDYGAVIKRDDQLVIVVSGPDKTVCAPYNLTLGEMSTGGGYSSANPENATLTYLVDPSGNINFPTLGTIHVEGMTRNELAAYLQQEIGKDVRDPIVYVRIKNYKVTILGEVKSPGVKYFDSERVTIMQALGQAGDLALTAEREGILLIREIDGVPTHYRINLKSADIMNEPYYFLQQNDVIYVPANPRRIHQATMSTSIWSFGVSILSTTMSVATFVVTFISKSK